MLVLGSHPYLRAQEVTSQAPAAVAGSSSSGSANDLPDDLPDDPGQLRYPTARPLPAKDNGEDAVIESDRQSESNGRYVLDGNVVITYRGRTLRADHIEYDSKTGDLTATGHLLVTGGPNDEHIEASHGIANLKQQTGRFYDVKGSVGIRSNAARTVYTSANPFLFTGRLVIRTSATTYQVYDGMVTSCQLPHPDWQLSAGEFDFNNVMAHARNSVFRLFNVPLFYLPYVTHPVDVESRQTGLLIPVLGQSSSKGFTLGEEFYLVLNRSMDLTVGGIYYSLRGYSQSATFRYRGRGLDFATAHFSALQDRGYTPPGGVYTNQGGEDVYFIGRHDFSSRTRVAASAEYLSSYPYREAFTDNFNQAVSTDILSTLYGVHETDGIEASARADRYQGLKRAGTAATPTTPAIPEQQVRIFHAPSLDLNTTEHRLGATSLLWSLESSAAGLKRVQPDFASGGIVERFDLHPKLSAPFSLAGWRFTPTAGVRETYYTRDRQAVSPDDMTVERTGGINRSDGELSFLVRPPVLERTFSGGWLNRLFGGKEIRHTIEPEVTYRYVGGVDNFQSLLRFDDADVVSDTNEIEYGLTQRLFVKHSPSKACSNRDLPILLRTTTTDRDNQALSQCSTSERVRWRLTQKYFFDPTFGHAVEVNRRNIFDSTLSLSGVAFLTEPREISPLISRLHVQTSEKTDLEWDFDFDTGAKKFTSNNIFADVREGNAFAGISYARLNAPGRFYTDGLTSANSNFSQLRALLGYGSPTRPGFGIAANAGFDLVLTALQYASVQTSYNWNCCGFSVEYRKFELGSVRNESAYRFNFTLANIGSAGNLRRAERLF